MNKGIKIVLSLSLLCMYLVFLSSFAFADSAHGAPITEESYEISRSKVEREVSLGTIFRDEIEIRNFGDSQKQVSLFIAEDLEGIVELTETGGFIDSNNETTFYFTIKSIAEGNYQGDLTISGDILESIPINITVVNGSLDPEFFIVAHTTKKRFSPGEPIEFEVEVKKVVGDAIKNVTFSYSLRDLRTNETHFLASEEKDILGSLHIRKKLEAPKILEEDYYHLEISATHENIEHISSAEFQVKPPFWQITLLGFLPLWLLGTILGVILVLVLLILFIRKRIKKSKKYALQLFTRALPKKQERSLKLGKIAEKTIPAYYDMDALTTHAVVAGATGGGKSISAQVFIEEVLNQDVAVIVFDPTAQWSGMLRKCEDKKMLSFYPKFGLKPSDAKAFPGNVRQIKNERQAVDVNKHIAPGQIQIFTLNKLTPPQIDTFVAGVIASIFKSDPKEHPNLKVLLVFDEVHRLLPKFGGSGKGFLQIERACREFRKWGFGVMLVSQVLSDFVGEIKANINTEVQMRTRDEADLNRLKTKYGEEFLQSLIKASVGVGMFVNAKYNKGKPYFINFRPILHNTRRLSDEVLEKYNTYNDQIDEIEYQIEQLEKEKVDVFDIKMELKLVKDKLMTGNFTVVDIYLEGLKPRIEKQWTSLGKTPKKKELELMDVSEIEASIKQAEKGRKEFEAKQKKEGSAGEEKEKKVDKESMIVAPLTLDNGIMISSLRELKDTFPNIDEEIFKAHVNESKNDISSWVSENIDKDLGSKLGKAKTREEMVKILTSKPQAKEESKEDKTKDKKKEEKGEEKESGEEQKSEKEGSEETKESNKEESKETKEAAGNKEGSSKEKPTTEEGSK